MAHPAGDDGAGSDDGFNLAEGRTLAALRDPETRRVLCTLLGVAVAGQNGEAGALVCEGFVDVCEQSSEPPEVDAAAPAPTVTEDLSGLFGCPLTATELDFCLADLLSIGTDGLSDVTCSSATPATIPPSALAGAFGCTALVFKCPQLFLPRVQSLGGLAQPTR